uniref:Storkhead box 1 n=2 Tax=Varanus komodoensis TaxID=61221 RepID=A0A8D2IW61_VARKO
RLQEEQWAPAEPSRCSPDHGEASGAAVFQAFRRANAACYWNAGLARAVARVWLHGWLRGGVLLLQGPAAPLQLLRDAWLRRALRPPKGFLIRAVGDVFPVHMNPILQSQFVPLAEVLCCAISDMNAAHITVTQETLLDQLGKHYPGIATPTHDTVYSTLGMLIKERKIYHTGEGYFIVTPNTYFISNNSMKSNKKVLLAENCPLEPSVTYLVSMEDATELIQDNLPVVSHCRSCHCFSDQIGMNEQRPQRLVSHDPNGKSQKDSCQSRLSVHIPATDMLVGNHSCETARSVHSMKEKEKVKKFGLSLFWRNTKKHKPKKVHSSFSAQFPPEEWPVRDEDNLDNIPRDVEHEIIKRINPVLTVDNLSKHTMLMQKIEEQKKYINKGTSTEVLMIKHKHFSKGCSQRKENKGVKHRRKVQSNKEKQMGKSHRKFKTEKLIPAQGKLENLVENPLACATSDAIAFNKQLCKDATDITSHFIYKKEIDNPFQDIPYRKNKLTRGHKSQKNSDAKSRAPRSERNFPRSQSLDSSRSMDFEAKQSLPVKCDAGDDKKQQVDYPQYWVLETDGKYRYLRESAACKHYLHRGTNPKSMVEIQVVSDAHAVLTDEGAEKSFPQNSSETHQWDQDSIYELLSQNSDQLKNVYLLSDTNAAHQFKQSENTVSQGQSNDLRNKLNSENASKWLQSINPQYDGLTYDEETQYQKEDDVDACSFLYLDADNQEQHMEMSKLKSSQLPFSSSDTGEWSNIKQEFRTEVLGHGSSNSYFQGHRTDMEKVDICSPEENKLLDVTKSQDSLKEYPKINLGGKSCVCHPIPQYAYKNIEGNEDLYNNRQISNTAETNVFDFCDVRQTETRIWQNSVNEAGGKLASLALSPKDWEIKTDLMEKQQAFDDTNDVPVLDQKVQQEQNHLEGTGGHSITGDSGIDSPRTQSMASANSAIMDGLKKRRSFLMNLEGIEKTLQSGKNLTRNSLLQLTPVMNV